MEKKSLQELRELLEELKTVKKTLVPKSEVYAPHIKEIDGVKYISLEDLAKGQFVTNERYICTLNNGEAIIREKIHQYNMNQPSYRQISEVKYRETEFLKTTTKKIKRDYKA